MFKYGQEQIISCLRITNFEFPPPPPTVVLVCLVSTERTQGRGEREEKDLKPQEESLIVGVRFEIMTDGNFESPLSSGRQRVR